MRKITREQAVNFTLLLLRIAAAVIFIQAGGLKLFGWFGGMPAEVPMNTLIYIAGILEVFGGLMILFGIFTRSVAFILSGEMAVAYFMGHFPSGFWPIQNHGEAAFLLCFIFLFIASYGAGRWSLDSWKTNRKLKTL
ncbi:MAG: DoxX family protein [Patescibacteria group bacterium]